MLDSSLPLDIWSCVVGFLEIADLSSLLTTSKQIHDQDVIYEHLAKRRFPLHLLDVSLYENSSWKTLLHDDNAKNGYYRLQLNAVSCSRNNSDQRFNVNMIRSIAWDREENRIIFEVEAFGENDLPKASRTAVYRLDPMSTSSVTLHPVGRDRTHRFWCENYEHNGPSHQLYRINIDASAFRPGHNYTYRYPAHSDRGRDYRPCAFLDAGLFQSLPALFALEMPSCRQGRKRKFAAELPPDHSRVPASRGHCDFVSRSTLLRPSNILEWKGVSLPPAIRERHGRGAWGAVRALTL
jgi:hypothetical protein